MTISRLKRFARLSLFALAPRLALAQTPSIDRVVNSASYTNDLGTGSMATVFGQNLASAGSWCQPTTPPLPTSLCDTTVTIGTQDLPLFFVSPGQINLQLPYTAGTQQLTVTTKEGTSAPASVTVLQGATGVFVYGNLPGLDMTRGNIVAASRLADNSIMGTKTTAHLGTDNNDLGRYVLFYVTGLRLSDPAPEMGHSFSTTTLTRAVVPQVFLDGVQLSPSNLTFAGGAPGYVGLYQVNVLIPSTARAGALPVQFCDNGTCSNVATVFVSKPDTTYVAGSLTAPPPMSDGVVRKPSDMTGTLTSTEGVTPVTIDVNGNFLVPLDNATEQDATLALSGNGMWENYKDTIALKSGKNTLDTIPAFPHLVYKDVKGTYDRDTRTWTNVSKYNFNTEKYFGGSGDVTLFDLVHYLSTNPTSQTPACREIIENWNREDKPIKTYIDPANQQYFDPKTTLPIQGSAANAQSGADLVWDELSKSAAKGGPAFQRSDKPLAPDEHGWTIMFVDPATMPGKGGLTWTYGDIDGSNTTCNPITAAKTWIPDNMGDSGSLQGAANHEKGRATSYGANPTGATSPFLFDNMGVGGSRKESDRDQGGHIMGEFLGYGVDLSKIGK